MLLIDGVRYEEWKPEKEVEEFHPIVKEHYKEIFGNNSMFIEGSRLKSEAGKGSVPDGFVVELNEKPRWYIVEIELSTHELYDHIVNQVGRFINGIKYTETQKKLIEAVYHHIQDNKQRKAEFEETIGSGEIYKYVSDLITKPPVLIIVIEESTPELDEALDLLKYSPIKIIEFQTFTREEADLRVHAHLFEPLFQTPTAMASIITTPLKTLAQVVLPKPKKGERRVTAKDLIDANILRVGQIVYGWHHNTKYEAKVLYDGSIELLQTGKKLSSLNEAVYHIKDSAEDAWRWWLTTREDGSECVLGELRKEYRRTHPSNP